MFRPEQFYLKDTVSTTSQIHGYDEPQPAALFKKGNETTFSFTVYVNNATYNNDDNPYGSFKLHLYTNMEDANDTRGTRKGFQDVIIPL